MGDNGDVLSSAPRPVTALRLLPWTSPDGKPCYLSTDEGGSLMSRLADGAEQDQLSEGSEVLAEALTLLAGSDPDVLGLRRALRRTAESLGDVLRVAESRGARLPVPGDGPGDDDGEGPRLPAEAFG
ncbi:hypothetical protein OG310_17290 [Streptomyces sp. NBC_01497]